ncbi:sigma factor-like helix-turn-helix DNA-binding protein [Streptomyces sp. NPDC055607]
MTQAAQTSQATEPDRPAAVYRYWSGAGELLYVGSAYDPKTRAKTHKGKEWWPLVASRTDEWHASRQAAYAAETKAIETESPTANKISGPGAVVLPAPKMRAQLRMVTPEEADTVLAALKSERPEVRFKECSYLLECLDYTTQMVRRQTVRKLRSQDMTYRQIAKELDISFGRVRQILAEDTTPAAE